MKSEYGGYIEFETYNGYEYHPHALALNCGRNALAYLIKRKQIKKIYLPYFICSSVIETAIKAGAEVEFYHIGMDLRPINTELEDDCWLYLVNYYGQISNDEILKLQNDRLIVDNSQAFFQLPVERIDTIYTCRKFFGVADGAYLYTDTKEDFEEDVSYNRMNFLLGRFEKGPNDFYQEYVKNNISFKNEPIKSMSKLTHNLLRAIDYSEVSETRRKNFEHLHSVFKDINKLNIRIFPDCAFMYPLYITDGSKVRKSLQEKRIYIPTLWPDVLERCSPSDLEYDMAENILPLPIDQRYNLTDMKYIADEVTKCLNSEN